MITLNPDEKLLWRGKPKQGLVIRDRDLILIPVSLIISGFAGFIFWLAFNSSDSLVLKGIAVALLLVAINLLLLRFVRDALKRKGTEYFITNQRVIKLFGRKQSQLKTLPIKNLGMIELIGDESRFSYISFGNNNSLFTWLFGNFRSTENTIAGLELIEDGERIFELLKALQSGNAAVELSVNVPTSSFSKN